MELIVKGKTKDVYKLENGNVMFQFKDSATVNESGEIDPGGNKVGATIDGLGKAALKVSTYYFEKINEAGFLTQYVESDLDAGTMTVKQADFFGKGVEIICRLKATGSFIRRYGDYCKEGQDLDFLVEVSLKDDEGGDPMACCEALEMLGIMTPEEYKKIKELTRDMTTLIRDDLADKGLTLYDLKLEFGKINGEIALIDEVSSGCMRVYKDNEWLHTVELEKYFS